MSAQPVGTDEFLTPADVAAILHVDPKTVTRWAITGKITVVYTRDGQSRFLKAEILGLRHSVIPAGAPLPWSHDEKPVPVPLRPSPVDRPADGVATAERHAAIAEATVVSEAVAIARELQAELTAEDATIVAEAVMQAAERAASAAEIARAARVLAAARAAEAVAGSAVQTAADVQRRADATALELAQAAALAAEVVAGASTPGHERLDAVTALKLAAIVRTAAIVTAEDAAAEPAESLARSTAGSAEDR